MPNQPTTLSQIGMIGGDLGCVGIPSMQNSPVTAAPVSSNPVTILPGTFVAVRNDTSMDQSRSLCAEFFSIEAVPLQIARAPIGEEHRRVPRFTLSPYVGLDNLTWSLRKPA